MFRTVPKILLLLACLASATPTAGLAQDAATLGETLPARILFVTSGGYWEETGQQEADKAADAGEAKEETSEPVAAPAQNRGYYRLIAIRGEDNRSLLQLQQIALTPAGPELAKSTPVEAINDLGGYVTDIRPEDSTGAASGPGFAAYVYLKTDPKIVEPETWSLYIDEFGDMQVERSSN